MQLSEMELKLVQLVADGCNRKTIYEQLGISVTYCRAIPGHIFSKIEASNMAHAVAILMRQGLIK